MAKKLVSVLMLGFCALAGFAVLVALSYVLPMWAVAIIGFFLITMLHNIANQLESEK